MKKNRDEGNIMIKQAKGGRVIMKPITFASPYLDGNYEKIYKSVLEPIKFKKEATEDLSSYKKNKQARERSESAENMRDKKQKVVFPIIKSQVLPKASNQANASPARNEYNPSPYSQQLSHSSQGLKHRAMNRSMENLRPQALKQESMQFLPSVVQDSQKSSKRDHYIVSGSN